MRALRLAEPSEPIPAWDGGRLRADDLPPACDTASAHVRLLTEADARHCWTLLVERASARRGWRAPPGLADIRRRIATLAAARADRRGLGLAVCAHGDGRLLGWLELEREDPAGRGLMLRLQIAPAAEAAITEGVLAALPAALHFLDGDMLCARLPADDEPALRLVRRLGLKPVRRSAGAGILSFQRELAGIL